MTPTPAPPTFILDISRLLARAGQSVPTGIDRIELAYADYLLSHHEQQSYFVALSPTGWMGALPHKRVKTLIATLVEGWNLGYRDSLLKARKIARSLKFYLFLGRSLPRFSSPTFYLLLSHHHLMRTQLIRRFLTRTGAQFIPMVHDLIPIEYPEYARPREPKRHKARMNSVVELANAVIVPTTPVKMALQRCFTAANRHNIPLWTVAHGVHEQVIHRLAQIKPSTETSRPYFVYLSTIEPRKNHLLLLHLWRRMVEERGKDATPQLILVGKRGWENENILDLLERCPALQGIVIEKNHLSDEDVAALLKSSNGLLFSSFTEGYGLPLAEAMSLAVPSICADIPVLREVGKEIPLYLDPLDTVSWQHAIDDFTQHGPLWKEQKMRLNNWKPIPWPQSVAKSLSLITS